MNDENSGTAQSCDRNDRERSNDDNSRRQIASIPFTGGSANYSHNNIGEYFPSYQSMFFPGSSYNNRQYLPVTYYYPSIYPARDSHSDLPSATTAVITCPLQNTKNWNPANPPSPLKRCATTDTSTLKARGKSSDTTESIPQFPPSPVLPSRTMASDDYIDPKILAAAKDLKLPLDGQKYSVTHWKDAMRLCYRWKTTTNEHERQFYRMSTTTNSLSSNNLKSVKNFCENVLKRKSKRRQFAIHWKESGLKKIVHEASSSQDVLFEHSDPKLERILDDYFSGRTRSSGYNQAKEKVLEDRQKEIVALWDALMTGPILSDASSRQKLYLIQLAIERPYRNKKVNIERKEQTITHDVTIEGYGGKSYWDQNNHSMKNDTKTDALPDHLPKSVDGVLPVNESMMERFWKCTDDIDTPVHHRKRCRSPFPLTLSGNHAERIDESTSSIEELSQINCWVSEKRINTRKDIQCEEDKENERSPIVPV